MQKRKYKCYDCIQMLDKLIGKRLQIISCVILAFILGCMFSSSLIPLERNCKLDNSDREYNIMKNSQIKDPDLIVIILSKPTNFDNRNLIRKTWLNWKLEENVFKIKHYFVIGVLALPTLLNKRISKEQIHNNDILMLPIQDSYNNLTDKIKYSFQWLDTQFDYGLKFKYLLKSDDDSFINLKKLASNLQSIESNIINKKQNNLNRNYTNNVISVNYQNSGDMKTAGNLYWGYFNGNARVKTGGKWKENNWIASDRYVPYALGGGYLLSKELVSYIGRNSEHLKSFNSEDVSVGLWLLPINNIYRVHDIRFDTEWISRGCKNHYIVTHNIPLSNIKMFYNNLVSTDKICSKEETRRKHYVYNWDLPPSQCCTT